VPFLWFALQAVALSIILAVAWQLTGRSLLLPVLLHASVNAFAVPLRVLPEDVASTRPYILTVALTWGCALILLWSLGCKQRRQLSAPLRERPAKQLRETPALNDLEQADQRDSTRNPRCSVCDVDGADLR
jgi:hypothetical protein